MRQYSTKPSTKPSPAPSALPHLTPTGAAHMVPIHTKAVSTRTAVAVGTVTFSNPTALELIRSNSNKKGDVLALARISGIMAAKKCADIVVLCHPIPISSVEVDVKEVVGEREGLGGGEGDGNGVLQIRATVTCEGKTGVEMEALTAVMGAALAVVDMCKAVDKRIVVGGVRVIEKRGGRSGDFFADGPPPVEGR
ncbi:molybdenum cofactor biosynthesis protein C [Tricharina praecox]|uniref:molybdenum cofactor biosynthesis protein C n=1 Tax=Tricharina praecox TaxID=43433 RepID=UPI00221EEC1F|nr:molybdenum cofactor biosynthesis protein C [Tricharina praecox]KAI5843168.1 molybdenum cofactor biosynthesis protein C [Tricharina praecox]